MRSPERKQLQVRRTGGSWLVLLVPALFCGTSAWALEPRMPSFCGNNRLVAFLSHPQDPVSGRILGELVSIAAPDPSGYTEIVLRDTEGNEHSIAWRGAKRRPYLIVGRTYDVRVEYESAPTQASSIVIRDDEGLVYAGLSDVSEGATVLKHGLPGFDLTVGRNSAVLSVVHGDDFAVIRTGESVRMGQYDVICLSTGTPDGAMETPPLSWIIVRNSMDDAEGNLALIR
jgi:hypothetical protein